MIEHQIGQVVVDVHQLDHQKMLFPFEIDGIAADSDLVHLYQIQVLKSNSDPLENSSVYPIALEVDDEVEPGDRRESLQLVAMFLYQTKVSKSESIKKRNYQKIVVNDDKKVSECCLQGKNFLRMKEILKVNTAVNTSVNTQYIIVLKVNTSGKYLGCYFNVTCL